VRHVTRSTSRTAVACELIRKLTLVLALLLVAGVQPAYAAEGIGAVVWPVANFAIMVWIIYYFGRGPFVGYLERRQTEVRKELVEAAALRTTATATLAEIEARMKALPGELDALRARGREEIIAEDQRIAAAAAAERERLLEQTRREIDLQLRLAKRELVEHAANLSIQIAAERIQNDITPADQDRLIDRYLDQVK
jgi:F-type H+-transporting ATPase subunit b